MRAPYTRLNGLPEPGSEEHSKKILSPRSDVGYGRAAKLRLEWVGKETLTTGHPYRAAKLRPRVAPGGNPGSYGFCTNLAANAANRKAPVRHAPPFQNSNPGSNGIATSLPTRAAPSPTPPNTPFFSTIQHPVAKLTPDSSSSASPERPQWPGRRGPWCCRRGGTGASPPRKIRQCRTGCRVGQVFPRAFPPVSG